MKNNVFLADYHSHSLASPDGKCPMEEMAEAGIRAGLDELCFTDHVDTMVWSTGKPRERYDWAELHRQFERAKSCCGARISLRLGAELGEATRDFPRAEKLMAGAELDFVIGSVHTLSAAWNWEDLYFLDPPDEATCRAALADYLVEVQKLAAWGQFDVLGHLTLPLRYLNENRGFHLTFDGFEEQIAEIFRTLLQNGCGIELNTNRGNEPLPCEKWLRLYRELGGELITLGSDAHTPEFVGCALRERQELLRACGFSRFAVFRERKPLWKAL